MTYKDYFVVEVKSNGKILRVKDEAVFLPFGSEYTLLLKNLNTKRVSVKITIDGQDILDNNSLILDGNSSAELEGFLRGNVARNRFRFIQKTEKIQQHRGDKPDDGLIRVEFAFEKPKQEPWIKDVIKEVKEIHHHHHDYTYYPCVDWTKITYGSSGDSPNTVYSMNSNNQERSFTPVSDTGKVTIESLGVQNVSQTPNIDEGITVKGSEVNQQFNYASIGELEEANVIIISLKGINQTGATVSKPVTTQEKLICRSCGTKNKSSFKFCSECGTFLE